VALANTSIKVTVDTPENSYATPEKNNNKGADVTSEK